MEVAEPNNKSFEGKLSEILAAITRFDERMSSMETRFTSQATALSDLADTIGKLNDKLQEMEDKTRKMERVAFEEKELLEGKLASLRESIAKTTGSDDTVIDIDEEKEAPPRTMPMRGPELRVTPPGQQRQQHHIVPDAWAEYRRKQGQKNNSAPALITPASQVQKPARADNKYTKASNELVWIKGYPRDLTTKQLRAEATRLLGLHDIDPEEVEVIVRGFGRSFAFKFQSADAARDFREEARDALHTWTDPRDKDIHKLKVHADKPLFVRLRDRIFSALWQRVLPKVQEKSPAARLGQSRGKLWVILEDCPYSLFSSRPDPEDENKFVLEADEVNCLAYNISKDEANVWMAQALRTVA
jgi:uncharacterized coiled-coil protein SlyX